MVSGTAFAVANQLGNAAGDRQSSCATRCPLIFIIRTVVPVPTIGVFVHLV
jgi:hypothetical protein